ncbi:MAG: sigma-54 dependent transcriptional regulator [Deltaproteobacteria bacterium]
MSESILIIDDEEFLCDKLKECLVDEGYDVDVSHMGKEGILLAKRDNPDLVLLDLMLPDINGIEALDEINGIDPAPVTILMSGQSNVDTAVSAIKKGAYDFIEKPFSLDKLKVIVKNALDNAGLKKSLSSRLKSEQKQYGFHSLIGRSNAIKNVIDLFEKLVNTDPKTILIGGESGTGKGLAAKMLHHNGARAEKPIIELNCAAIPETLLESELFGHEAGSFTDAKKMKTGIFEDANGGTIFLDEIADMSLALQAKLVKAVEERTFRRIGGKRDIKVDVRIVAATNKDLKEQVDKKLFREDLYHRLNVINFDMPSLRERKEDIPLLTEYFINFFNVDLNKNIQHVPEEVETAFMNYNWPGNVRELKSSIERAVLLSEGETLNPKYIQIDEQGKGVKVQNEQNKMFFELDMDKLTLEGVEEIVIKKALELNDWNQTKTAQMLGVTRQVLRNRMIKMDLLN